jgi:hypothetical protein
VQIFSADLSASTYAKLSVARGWPSVCITTGGEAGVFAGIHTSGRIPLS